MENDNNFDLDDLFENNDIFKPITKGLGFHHSLKEKADITVDLTTKSNNLKQQFENKVKNFKENPLLSGTISSPATMNMGELAPFYAEEEKTEINVNLNTGGDQLTEAGLTVRFIAWAVDLVIIISLLVMTLIATMFTSEIPLSYLSEHFMTLDLALAGVSISILFYIFYFTFFDKTSFSTPGKRMFGLKVLNIKGEDISLFQSLSRVVLGLISILSLGLGCLIKVQDKMTDTLVVKI